MQDVSRAPGTPKRHVFSPNLPLDRTLFSHVFRSKPYFQNLSMQLVKAGECMPVWSLHICTIFRYYVIKMLHNQIAYKLKENELCFEIFLIAHHSKLPLEL
jgi:hypothetical protein